MHLAGSFLLLGLLLSSEAELEVEEEDESDTEDDCELTDMVEKVEGARTGFEMFEATESMVLDVELALYLFKNFSLKRRGKVVVRLNEFDVCLSVGGCSADLLLSSLIGLLRMRRCCGDECRRLLLALIFFCCLMLNCFFLRVREIWADVELEASFYL